jgi:hypothetical protein
VKAKPELPAGVQMVVISNPGKIDGILNASRSWSKKADELSACNTGRTELRMALSRSRGESRERFRLSRSMMADGKQTRRKSPCVRLATRRTTTNTTAFL